MGSIWHNRAMHKSDTFHDMALVPKDSREVQHGPEQTLTISCWNKAMQAWLRPGDQRRTVLRRSSDGGLSSGDLRKTVI
jgi:hypothetical protein